MQNKCKRFLKVLAGIVCVMGIVGCETTKSSTTGSGGEPITLTIWGQYTGSELDASKQIFNLFEKSHPNIKINYVTQPSANYFELLRAASISRTGPDIANMWTGSYISPLAQYLQDLSPAIPRELQSKAFGLKYSSKDYDISKGIYVSPLDQQFYCGYYNKTLFSQAGITTVPTNWSELFDAAAKLKAKGITPIAYGGDGSNGPFYPGFDFAYMLSSTYSPDQLKGLYSGKIPWTSSEVEGQLNKWTQLLKEKYTNPNPLESNSLQLFEQGKAAMYISGSWDASDIEKALGAENVGILLPPFSEKSLNSITMFAGNGYSVTKYSKHTKEALEFIRFMTSKPAQQAIMNNGLVPEFSTDLNSNDPLQKSLLDYVLNKKFTVWPMWDNIIQVPVVNVMQKDLPAAFIGEMTVQHALSDMQTTLNQLPESQRQSANWGG